MKLDKFMWTREPNDFKIKDNTVEITTKPNTDLWQRTYYHFRNDNAPVYQMETEEKYFSFAVKTEFNDSHLLWSSFFVTLLAKKYHYSIMQLPLLHAG